MWHCGNTSNVETVTVSHYYFTTLFPAKKFHQAQLGKITYVNHIYVNQKHIR